MPRLVAPALLSLIVILFHWKLILTNQYTWMESPDIVTQVLPWFQFQAGEWHKWRIPLWDPTSWYGQPLYGEAQPGAAYPLNWILFWMPLRHGWMQQVYLHWYYVVVRVLAALSAYALCRELGRSKRASIVGGCVYALGGFVGTTDWPQMVNGAITSPLVFLFLFRAERTRAWRDALLSGFFMGFGWLAGHHQMNLLVSLAAAGLWIWIAVRERRLGGLKIDWRIVKMAACAVIVAVLASGLLTIPTAEYGSRAVRWVGLDDPIHFDETVPYSIHQQYSMKPVGLWGVLIPGIEINSNPFIGITALALGILGALAMWREKYVRWLVVIACCGLLYALGFNSVFHGVLYALVPLVEKARVPAAGTVVFAVVAAPLVAFGLDALSEGGVAAWSRIAGWSLVAASVLAAIASLIVFQGKMVLEIADNRMMITAVAALGAAAILAGWRVGTIPVRAGSAAILLLILIELGNVTDYQLPNRYRPAERYRLHWLSEHGDLAAFLAGNGEQARVDYDADLIPYNFGAWHGIETFQGEGASVLADLWRMDVFTPRVRDFFGNRYWMGKAPSRPDQVEVFRGARGINVYENPGAFPRVFSVHQSVVEKDPRKLAEKFANPKTDLRRTVLLSEPPPAALENCAVEGDEVAMPIHAPNYVAIKTRLGCRGLVILTDNWFPGWRATVDGKPADILQVDGAIRGVIVEAGSHRIEMRYRPWSVLIGGLMTLAATVLAAIASWKRW